MRKIEYNSFEEAFAAMLEFVEKGIKCKGIDPTPPPRSGIADGKRPIYDFV